MTKVSHAPLLRKLALVVLVMFGFAFALVPLYDVFCRITGLNGKTSDQAASTERAVIDSKQAEHPDRVSCSCGYPDAVGVQR